MADFGTLYDYRTAEGTVVPLVDDVKENVIDGFKDIFGPDFNTNEETINGRLIEAVTLLFKNVCGVNAQNAGMVNPDLATGDFLDNIGALFGVARDANESDYSYRRRIKSSKSVGSGFAESIKNAIGRVAGTSQIVVLDNGNEDPAMLPIDEYGSAAPHAVRVDPHSVLVSVLGGLPTNIAKAIRTSKSAGCSFTRNPELGTVTTGICTESGITYKVYYYTPSRIFTNIAVSVRDDAYTGANIETDTKTAIVDYFSANGTNLTVGPTDIMAVVAAAGKGIIVDSVTFATSSTGASGSYATAAKLIISPVHYVSVETTDITVTVT